MLQDHGNSIPRLPGLPGIPSTLCGTPSTLCSIPGIPGIPSRCKVGPISVARGARRRSQRASWSVARTRILLVAGQRALAEYGEHKLLLEELEEKKQKGEVKSYGYTTESFEATSPTTWSSSGIMIRVGV